MKHILGRQLALVLALLVISVLALYLRLDGIDWDGYEHFHPDERYISWVASSIEFSGHDSLAEIFDPRKSRLNPYYWPAEETTSGIVVPFDEPRRFAYGHFPLYLTVGTTRLLEKIPAGLRENSFGRGWLSDLTNYRQRLEFDHLTAVGRGLAALFDVGSVLLIFFLGRALFSTRVGLTAALFLALNVMHIQLAHFFIFDTFATFFVVLTLLALVLASNRADSDRRRSWLLLAAVAAGLAIGSKFSTILILIPFTLGVVAYGRERFWRRMIGLLSLAALVFAVTNPFALLDRSCPLTGMETAGGTIALSSCYVDNILRESVMVRGGEAFPFTRQYDGTLPFIYPIEMQLRWGMGWLLGLSAFAGFFAFTLRGIDRLWREKRVTALPVSSWLLLSWSLPFFVSTGSFVVKFMRYLQPLTPLLMVFAAWGLWRLRPVWLRRFLLGVTVLFTAGYAFAFNQMYSDPHPWIVLSEWVYDNASAGETITIELWDETLPATIEREGKLFSRRRFEMNEINWFSGRGTADNGDKLHENLSFLAGSDYFIVASNRNYGVIPGLPQVYPLSSRFYPLLFAGELGFAPIFISDRPPHLFGWYLTADTLGAPDLQTPPELRDYFDSRQQFSWGRADESFTVYDHPLAVVWVNRDRLTVDEMEEKFTIK